MSYLTKEMIKRLKEPIPKEMCAYAVCKNCKNIILVDFETALALILLMPEEDLEKNKKPGTQWTDHYIETGFCPSCRNDSNHVGIKKIPKET
jgi:hypothetical protein